MKRLGNRARLPLALVLVVASGMGLPTPLKAVLLLLRDGTVLQGQILAIGDSGLQVRSLFPVVIPKDGVGDPGRGVVLVDGGKVEQVMWDDSGEKRLFGRRMAELLKPAPIERPPETRTAGEEERTTPRLPGIQVVGLFEGGVGVHYYGNDGFRESFDIGLGPATRQEALLRCSVGAGVTWRNSVAVTVEDARSWGVLGTWEGSDGPSSQEAIWADIEDLDMKVWFLGPYISPFILVGKTLHYELRLSIEDLTVRYRTDREDFHFGGGLLLGRPFAHTDDHFRGGLNLELIYRPHTFATIEVEDDNWGTQEFATTLPGDSIDFIASALVAYAF